MLRSLKHVANFHVILTPKRNLRLLQFAMERRFHCQSAINSKIEPTFFTNERFTSRYGFQDFRTFVAAVKSVWRRETLLLSTLHLRGWHRKYSTRLQRLPRHHPTYALKTVRTVVTCTMTTAVCISSRGARLRAGCAPALWRLPPCAGSGKAGRGNNVTV